MPGWSSVPPAPYGPPRASGPYGPAPGAAAGQVTERPGVGLALVLAGIVLALTSLLALPWVDAPEGFDDATLLDVRSDVSDAPEPTEVIPDFGWWYIDWIAFATFGVVAGLGLLAGIGLRSSATVAVRTLGVVAALGACFVHWLGVDQMFGYGGEPADTGPVLMYAAYGLMLVGSVLGPRKAP